MVIIIGISLLTQLLFMYYSNAVLDVVILLYSIRPRFYSPVSYFRLVLYSPRGTISLDS